MAKSLFTTKLSVAQRAFLCSNLGYYLKAGVSLDRALKSLGESKEVKPNLKKVILGVVVDLEQGKSLAKAFGNFPRAFGASLIALVAAAEESGDLIEVLEAVGRDFKREDKLWGDLKQALTYPLVVFSSMLLTMLLMVLVVLPKVATMYERMQIKAPAYTKFILGMGVFLSKNLLWVVLVVGVVGGLGVIGLWRIKKLREGLKRLVAGMPVIKNILSSYDLARFCRSTSLLYGHGIEVTKALRLGAAGFFKPQYREAVAKASEEIEKGVSLKVAFASQKIFPSLVVELLGVGEESASLKEAFANLAEYFDAKVTEQISRGTALLEPVFLILLGLMVGGMIFSIITPIYQMVGGIV